MQNMIFSISVLASNRGSWVTIVFLILFFGVPILHAEPLDKEYPDFIEQLFLTEEAALKLVFPDAEEIVKKVHVLTKQQKSNIESRLGWILEPSSVTVTEGYRQGHLQGFAVVTEEIGKFKPITFMVKVSVQGEVERVEVLVYREAVGAEVRHKRFTRQFKGRSAKSPLRINRDILNITGATMSVQAITAGVKKVLVILDEIYFRK